MKTLLLVTAVLFVMVGCQAPSSSVPDSLPAVGGALERVSTRVSGAEALVTQAARGSTAIVKALLDASLVQLGFVKEDLAEARVDLGKAEGERDLLEQNYAAEHAARVKDEAGWGFKLQVIWGHVWRVFMLLLAVHYLALGLSLFLPPPWSVIAGTVGNIVNPLGWFTWLVGHIRLNRATAAGSTSSGVISEIFPGASQHP